MVNKDGKYWAAWVSEQWDDCIIWSPTLGKRYWLQETWLGSKFASFTLAGWMHLLLVYLSNLSHGILSDRKWFTLLVHFNNGSMFWKELGKNRKKNLLTWITKSTTTGGITNKQLIVTKTCNHLHVLSLISGTAFDASRDNGGVLHLSLRKSSSLSLESDFLHWSLKSMEDRRINSRRVPLPLENLENEKF